MYKKALIITSFCNFYNSFVFSQGAGGPLLHSSSIHTITIFFPQSAWYDLLIAYTPPDKKMKGDVSINGYTITNIGIRFKGNSSFNQPSQKKSWKIDFNEFVSGQKSDRLKAINLNNGSKAPTLNQLAANNCYVYVKEHFIKNNIRIYPSPAIKEFFAYVPDVLNNTDLQLYDFIGKRMNIQIIKVSENLYVICVPVESKGVYMLLNGKAFIHKIILL